MAPLAHNKLFQRPPLSAVFTFQKGNPYITKFFYNSDFYILQKQMVVGQVLHLSARRRKVLHRGLLLEFSAAFESLLNFEKKEKMLSGIWKILHREKFQIAVIFRNQRCSRSDRAAGNWQKTILEPRSLVPNIRPISGFYFPEKFVKPK